MNPRIALLAILTLLLSACASGPRFETKGVDGAITPQRAVVEGDTLRGGRVLWGGVIITSANLADATQIEVLAYPLDSDQWPVQSEQPPQGRFIVRQEGYLETSEYAPGRIVTVIGALDGVQLGTVGEAEYRYPVVVPGKLHLWPKAGKGSETRFHFGIGVMFSN